MHTNFSTSGSSLSVQSVEGGGDANIAGMRIKKGKLLGRGAFGSVYQAMNTMSGELLAIKQLPIAHNVTAHTLRGIEREIAINSSLPPHPHCVKYLGVQSTQRNIYIVMEHVSGGSVQSLLQSVGQFHERTVRSYSAMILQGLQHLHRNNVIHQDIKGANVLLDEKGVAKIADFGCSKDLSTSAAGSFHSGNESGGASSTFHNAGTPLWMAPEVCRGEPATKSSDIWSFGCLLLEMVTPEHSPWVFAPGTSAFAVLYAIGAASKPPQPPAHLSPIARDFISRCLVLDASKRPTVDDLLNHPFITGKGQPSPLSQTLGGWNSHETLSSGTNGAGAPRFVSGTKTENRWEDEWDGAGSSSGPTAPSQSYRGHAYSNSGDAVADNYSHIQSPSQNRGPGGGTIAILPKDAKLNLREIYLHANGTTRKSGWDSQTTTGRTVLSNGHSSGGRSSVEFSLNAVDSDDESVQHTRNQEISEKNQLSESVGVAEHFCCEEEHTGGRVFARGDAAEDAELMMVGESQAFSNRQTQSYNINYSPQSQVGLPFQEISAGEMHFSYHNPKAIAHQQVYYYHQSGGSGAVPVSLTTGFQSPDATGVYQHTSMSPYVDYQTSESCDCHASSGENSDGTITWQSARSDVVDGSNTLFNTEEMGTHTSRTNVSETNRLASFFSKKFKCINPLDDGHKRKK